MIYKRALFNALILLSLSSAVITTAVAAKLPEKGGKPEIQASAVASAHPLATKAGISILKAGGNAFDAAIAVSAVLAVVEPYSSGLGGGGFWLLHRYKDNKTVMIDARERAPLAATRTLYQDKKGNVIPGLSINGVLAAGIPGEPAAFDHLAKNYGRLTLAQSLAPAIALAEKGFKVDSNYVRLLKFRLKAIKQSKAAAKIFLLGGKIPPIGSTIVQKDLAKTLRLLAKQGRKGFYQGETADRLISAVKKAGGIWTHADLKQYTISERHAVKFKYKGLTLYSASPPSSGGIALAEILNMLEPIDLQKIGGAKRIHFIVEAMRRAYRDRAEHLGDADFHSVPQSMLVSKKYARKLFKSVKEDKATPSSALKAIYKRPKKSRHTTHYSIVDRFGNRVAATLSINYPFGSCYVAPGTGVLLNDEMDDFSSKPGTPNAYGLVGGEANAIEPGKRPLSSMSPTMAESENRVIVLGTPGGSRIITMVLLGLLEFEQGKSAQQIIATPRFHHQYLPDVIQYEPKTFTSEEIVQLKSKGHVLKEQNSSYGNMQVIIVNKKSGKIDAASDLRGIGSAVVINQK